MTKAQAIQLPSDLTDQADLLAMLDIVVSREKLIRSQAYVPHGNGPDGGQAAFHESDAYLRMVLSANRFGKTRMAAEEIDRALTDKDPFRKYGPPPLRARSVCEGFDYGVDAVLLPLLRNEVIDPKDLRGGSWATGYSKQEHTIYYGNGSTWQLMSYKLADMGRGTQVFGGIDLDICHHDETSPYDIFVENSARLVKRSGRFILTFTPILGMTWEHDKIYEPWIKGIDRNIACFRGTMFDNPYLPREAVQRFADSIKDQATYNIRVEGLWQAIAGRVYLMYRPEIHVVPYNHERVRRSMKFGFIDPAPSKPTAVLWCGWDGEGFAYREAKITGTPEEVVREIRELSQGERVTEWYIDPHWDWKNNDAKSLSTKQQYLNAGLPVRDATSDKWGRITLLQDAFSVGSMSERPMFVVFDSCPMLDFEIRYKQYRPQKDTASYRPQTIDRDDDLLTCFEYFAAINPGMMFAQTNEGIIYPTNILNNFGRFNRMQVFEDR